MKKKSSRGKAEIVPALLRRIRKEFPGLEWRAGRYIGCGFDHHVLILDEKLVFRFPKRISREHPDEFADEIRLMKYLGARLSTPIPQYSYVARDRSFAGYKIIPGRELTASHFRKLTIRDRSTVAHQLADFLTRLHATPKEAVQRHRVPIKDYRAWHAEFVRRVKEYIRPWLTQKENRIIDGFLAELEAALDHDYRRALTNSDLLAEHILWDRKERRIGIIDFSDRVYGDPAGDFAGLLNYGTGFTKKVMDLYGGNRDERMFHRARLYHKRIPLYIMMDAHRGFPCSFKQGYGLFKKRFLG